MNSDGAKALALVLAAVVVGVLLTLWGQRLLGAAGGAELEILAMVKYEERGVEWQIADAGTFTAQKVQYQRLSVAIDQSGESATVTGTLDITGRFRGQTVVSSLGFERIGFALVDGAWRPVDGFAPRLQQIIVALEARRRLLDGGDLSLATGEARELERLKSLRKRSYSSNAWFIRSEREGVEVSEEFTLRGDAPDRPVHETGTKRLELSESPTGFLFPHGIM